MPLYIPPSNLTPHSALSGYAYAHQVAVAISTLRQHEEQHRNITSPVWCALYTARDGSCFNATFGNRHYPFQMNWNTAIALSKQFLIDNFRSGPRVRCLKALVPYSAKEKGW
jgi:hypothetical protein